MTQIYRANMCNLQIYKSIDNVFDKELVHLVIEDTKGNKFEHILLDGELREETKEILLTFNRLLTSNDINNIQNKIYEYMENSRDIIVERYSGFDTRDVYKHILKRLNSEDIIGEDTRYVCVSVDTLTRIVENNKYIYGWNPSDIVLHLIYEGYIVYENSLLKAKNEAFFKIKKED